MGRRIWDTRSLLAAHTPSAPPKEHFCNFIYSNDTVNYVWTGSNPATVVHAHEGSGVIHCESPGIVVYTSHHAKPHYKLDGCRRISFYSVGY